MANEFQYDVFLSHSATEKGVVRPLAERLRQDGLKVWFDEWGLKPGDNIPAKIEAGLEHSRVLVLCMSAHAFGSDWAQLEAGTFRFRDPLKKERRFIPLRLDDATSETPAAANSALTRRQLPPLIRMDKAGQQRIDAFVRINSLTYRSNSNKLMPLNNVNGVKTSASATLLTEILVSFVMLGMNSVLHSQVDVTQPGDPIILVNGYNDDDAFDGPPPATEGVEHAIDNVGQKHLNFLDLNSGLAVQPGIGRTIVTGLRVYTANDEEPRDPASFHLEGSWFGLSGPWIYIADGPLALPSGRNPVGNAPLGTNFGTVTFENATPYVAYRVVFPNLKNAFGANSMQIGEIELLGTLALPVPPNGPGNALSFDGVDDHVVIPEGVWFSGDFTIEGWVFVRSHSFSARLLDFGNGAQNNNVLVSLSDGPTGQPRFLTVVGNTIGPGITAPSALPLNTWTHLACVFNGSSGTGTMYINGVVVASGPMSHPASVVRTNCYLGRSNWPGDGYANAIFDEVRIWNVGRTAGQIQGAMRRQLFGNEPGLFVCWRFDEVAGATASDIVRFPGNATTLVNGPVWTNSTIAPFAPTVTTLAPSLATPTTATLNGSANPNGAATTASFQWGTNASLGNVTPPQSLGSGTAPVTWSNALPGFIPAGSYVYRAVATNAHGASFGSTGTRRIVSNINDSGPGSLRDALAASANGDWITFAVTGAITLTSGQLVVTNSLSIEGPGANLLTISGNNASLIFRIHSGWNFTLKGLTLTRGNGGEGGAVRHSGGSLLLEECVIIGNSTWTTIFEEGSGAGIYSDGRSLTIINSTVSGNSAGINSEFGNGGGIYAHDALIINSTVSGNSVGNGGGIFARDALIINSTVSSNSAFRFGGLAIDELTIINSTVSGNSAKHWWGGINARRALIINSTVSSNSASRYGGLAINELTLENSIVAGNSAPNDPNIGFITLTSVGVNLTNGAPMLAPLGFYGGPTQTMPPRPGSPAIDRAIPTTNTPATDQRGGWRVVDLPTVPNDPGGNGLDIGAVEVGGVVRIVDFLYFNPSIGPSFTTEPGWSHRVESKDALAPGPWAVVPNSTRTGDGSVINVPDIRPAVPQRFYRVVIIP